MSRSRLIGALSAAAVISATAIPSLPALASSGPAVGSTEPASANGFLGEVTTPDFDVRHALPRLAPTAAQRSALRRMDAAVSGDLTVTWNRTYGTPRMISTTRGYLTAPAAGDALQIARGWLSKNAAAFGLSKADVARLAVIRNHTLPKIGARVITFQQTFGGLQAVQGAVLTVTLTKNGRILSYAGAPVRSTALRGSFAISSTEALSKALSLVAPALAYTPKATGETQAGYQVFSAGPFLDVQRVKQVAFAVPGNVRSAYNVLLVVSTDQAWSLIIDGATGEVLARQSLVDHEAEGTVYENYPGAPNRGGRPTVVSFGPTPQSPGGWVDPTGMAGLPGPTTFGNNANAFEQITAPLAPLDQPNRPVSPTAQFNYDYEANWATSGGAMVPPSFVLDRDPAVTNLFFHHNRIHDEYYEFGFTETAGNFQLNNFGKGGNGGDAVMGLAHSGAISGGSPTYQGRDNANFLTLPDGIPGLTSMYLWEPIDDTFEGPYSDGDFDAGVIQHEYSHGLSNRYVGGGGLLPLATHQSGSMGEGWGDWYAMNHLYREGILVKPIVGEFATGNYDRGIRNWRYDQSPLTYGDVGYDLGGPEVHSDGEIWTATLWQLSSALYERYGRAKGTDVAEHLVTDAMPLSPVEPSFLDMRDAILQADKLRFKSANTDLIWSVFADRGMGKSAKTVDGEDTDPTPAFDHASAKRNGNLTLTFVSASTGKPVKGAHVLGGELEARVTPWRVADAKGKVSGPVVAGKRTFTVQAPGFGHQRVTLKVPAGRALRQKIELDPNLASTQNGAKVVSVTSEDPGLPASFLFDDTVASAWRTRTAATTYNAEGPQSTVVKLAAKAKVDEIHVSAIKPSTASRFVMVDRYSIEVSADGKKWKPVVDARYGWSEPRPTVSDMAMKTIRFKPVKAGFVRVTIKSIVGETKQNAVLAEVQVFGDDVRGVKPAAVVKDKPVSEAGSILAGNISQGSLLQGTAPYVDGVTTASWVCGETPAAQGADAWIMPLPSGFADGQHRAYYTTEFQFIGESYLWFYDGDCNPIAGDFATDGQKLDIPPGAAYVGVLYLYGAGFDFTLTAEQR